MKKLTMLLGLTLCAAVVMAQDNEGKKSSYPHWAISKDVQRFQFRNIEVAPLTITTGNAAWVQSKGVSQTYTKRSDATTGKVVMTGMPSSVISKGVARMQYEKNNKGR